MLEMMRKAFCNVTTKSSDILRFTHPGFLLLNHLLGIRLTYEALSMES